MLPRNDTTEVIGFALSRIVVPLWILMGVTAKLHAGTARNLPSNIVDLGMHWRLDMDAVLYTLIGLEIFAILVMVLIAKLARPMAIFMLVTFVGILIGEIAKGAENCGCFGGTIPIEPWQMLAADLLLLAGVVFFRPPVTTWPGLGRIVAIGAGSLVVGLAASFGIGYALHGEDDRPAPAPVEPRDDGEDFVDDPTVNPAPKRVPRNWYPTGIPSWIGQPWREIEIFQFMERWPEGLDEGTHYIVFYSRTCTHCQVMFEEDLIYPLDAPVVAIEIPATRTELTNTRDAWDMPPIDPGVTLTNLPLGPNWSLMTAPLALRIEDGVVTCAKEGDHKECFELE